VSKRRRRPLRNEVLHHLRERAEKHLERESWWFVQPDDDDGGVASGHGQGRGHTALRGDGHHSRSCWCRGGGVDCVGDA
jgi:hypothetical protein